MFGTEIIGASVLPKIVKASSSILLNGCLSFRNCKGTLWTEWFGNLCFLNYYELYFHYQKMKKWKNVSDCDPMSQSRISTKVEQPVEILCFNSIFNSISVEGGVDKTNT